MTVTQDRAARVAVPVFPGRLVMGRVIDPEGRSVEGVACRGELGDGSFAVRALATGLDGAFAFESAPPQPFDVVLERRGFVPARVRVADAGSLGPIVLQRVASR